LLPSSRFVDPMVATSHRTRTRCPEKVCRLGANARRSTLPISPANLESGNGEQGEAGRLIIKVRRTWEFPKLLPIDFRPFRFLASADLAHDRRGERFRPTSAGRENIHRPPPQEPKHPDGLFMASCRCVRIRVRHPGFSASCIVRRVPGKEGGNAFRRAGLIWP
jgi:hypothetical protein